MDWGAQGREAFVIESGATNRTPRSRSSSWLRPTRPPTAGSCLINSASPMQNASCMLLTSSASSTTSMLSLTAQMPFAQRKHTWWQMRNNHIRSAPALELSVGRTESVSYQSAPRTNYFSKEISKHIQWKGDLVTKAAAYLGGVRSAFNAIFEERSPSTRFIWSSSLNFQN